MRRIALVGLLLLGALAPAAHAQAGSLILECRAEGFAPLTFAVRRGDMRRYLTNGWSQNLCEIDEAQCSTTEGVFSYFFEDEYGAYEDFTWSSDTSDFLWQNEALQEPVRGGCVLASDPAG